MRNGPIDDFEGVLRRSGERLYLQSGGIDIELMLAVGVRVHQPDGARMHVAGRQEGSRIVDARPLPAVAPEPSEAAFAAALAAAAIHRDSLKALPGVVNVRPGYRRIAGQLTHAPTVVVAVQHKQPIDRLAIAERIPVAVDGVPVDVVEADPDDPPDVDWVARWRAVLAPPPAEVTAVAAAARSIAYRPPPDVQLDEHTIDNVLCHIGPDGGAPLLRRFLAGTQTNLTVSMYELTQRWIIDALVSLGRAGGRRLELVLQENAAETATVAELRDAWRDRLTYAKAVVSGPNRIFANSLHTKVAVRDRTALWLSSGNWSPHSQPDVPVGPNPAMYRLGNREWHVIIEDAKLARMFEAFVGWDRQQAATVAAADIPPAVEQPDLLIPEAWFLQLEAAVIQPEFAPAKFPLQTGDTIRVQPVMTPDNYGPAILELIDQARDTLFMQYAYIRAPHDADRFADLVKAVAAKMRQGVDVRVIVDSRNVRDGDVDLLLRLGWDRTRWKRQTTAVHNKGMLVDGAIALVSSQNWSSDGTQSNRDAGVIFHSEDVAAYFDQVFQFDWSNLTKPIDTSEVKPAVADPGAPTPPGMVRIPWTAWYAG